MRTVFLVLLEADLNFNVRDIGNKKSIDECRNTSENRNRTFISLEDETKTHMLSLLLKMKVKTSI
jgi:hypothetical protein